MAGPLVNNRFLTARFKAGTTALGHRWELSDGDGAPVGVAAFRYDGVAGRALGRLTRVTGLAAGNDLKADIKDAAGAVVATLQANNDKLPTVDLRLPDGSEAGRLVHERGTGLRVEAGPSQTVLATIATAGDSPWEVHDAGGARIGILGKGAPAPRVTQSWYELIGWDASPQHASDFQATMHHGFANSTEYTAVTDPDAQIGEPLQTFLALLPVLAAYSY